MGSQSSGAVRKFCAGEAEGAPAGCDSPRVASPRPRQLLLLGVHLPVATGALLLGVRGRGGSSVGGVTAPLFGGES